MVCVLLDVCGVDSCLDRDVNSVSFFVFVSGGLCAVFGDIIGPVAGDGELNESCLPLKPLLGIGLAGLMAGAVVDAVVGGDTEM